MRFALAFACLLCGSSAALADEPRTERRKVFVFDGASTIFTPVTQSLPVTVEAWVYPDPQALKRDSLVDMFIVGSDDARQATGIGVRIAKNGGLGGKRNTHNPKQRDFPTDGLLTVGAWSHVAVTFQEDLIQFFVDGKKTKPLPGATRDGKGPFVFGYIGSGAYQHPGCYFVGKMRTMRITDGIRYRNDFSPEFAFKKDEPGEMNYKTRLIYDAANLASGKATDLSGNRNHGLLFNIKIDDEVFAAP